MIEITSNLSLNLLWELGLIIVAAAVFNFIAKKLKQPTLLAYILAGIFIGPYFLNFLANTFSIDLTILKIANIQDIALLSKLGVAFLLFSVGIESDFLKLKSFGKLAVIGGTLQVALTALFTYILAYYTGILDFNEALYLAVILAFSSTMIVVKLLSDSFTIDTLHGRIMLGFLLVQDVLVILLMPLLSNLKLLLELQTFANFIISGAVLMAVALIASRFIYPRIFSFSAKGAEMLFLGSLSICFVFMFLAESLGIPMAIGAFIAGLSLSVLPYSFEIYDEIKGVRDFFVTIFFVTLGMQLNFFQLSNSLPLLLLSFLVVFIIKPAIFYLLCLFAGYGKNISFTVALGLSQVSEFSFLLAGQGLAAGLISQDFYSTIIFIIGLSMVVTPYFFKYRQAFMEFIDSISSRIPIPIKKDLFNKKIKHLEEVAEQKGHIVIVGGGVVGSAIAKFLKDKPLLIIDHDPDVVALLRAEGFTAVYGEAENKTLWNKLNLKDAKMLVLAIPQFEASMHLLNYAKHANPKIVIFARAHKYDEAKQLYDAGADFVCIPEAAGSNILIKEIVEYLETNSLRHVNALRDELLKQLEEASKKQPKKKPFNHKHDFI